MVEAKRLAARPAASDRWWRDSVLTVGVFLLYVLTGKVGLQLAFVHESATAVWAPSGLAVAAFLLFGFRLWPAILTGAFVVNVTTAGSVVTSAGLAVGNTLEALVAAHPVNRFAGGQSVFQRPQDIFKFALAAAVAPRRLPRPSASPLSHDRRLCGVFSLRASG